MMKFDPSDIKVGSRYLMKCHDIFRVIEISGKKVIYEDEGYEGIHEMGIRRMTLLIKEELIP